jgi:predicted nucleic acid-binding protein
VKAVDTGVLLAFLQGSTKARDLVRKSRGTELATTEANLLELAYCAGASSGRGRASRLAAIERLRQRLTVLPLDARGAREAITRVGRSPGGLAPTVALMLGALEAAGCEELWTDDPRAVSGNWRFRVTKKVV